MREAPGGRLGRGSGVRGPPGAGRERAGWERGTGGGVRGQYDGGVSRTRRGPKDGTQESGSEGCVSMQRVGQAAVKGGPRCRLQRRRADLSGVKVPVRPPSPEAKNFCSVWAACGAITDCRGDAMAAGLAVWAAVGAWAHHRGLPEEAEARVRARWGDCWRFCRLDSVAVRLGGREK
jgi:hypothetical protein